MSKPNVLICVAALVIVVVAVDFLLLREHFGARLIANVVIVAVFAAFYMRFFRRP